jgi:hypothetical protein
MQVAKTSDPLAARISDVLTDFADWLDSYGEKSWDFQSFFAGPVGGRAKALYYRHKFIGTAAVAPMIFCEAFLPDSRLQMLIMRWDLLSCTRRPESSRNWKRRFIF